jgi:hypothetical protein
VCIIAAQLLQQLVKSGSVAGTSVCELSMNAVAKSLSTLYVQLSDYVCIRACTKSLAVLHVNIYRSTYELHHQAHPDQLQRCLSMFAGLLTSYTTRHTKISCSLTYRYLQVNSRPTPPDTPRSATILHVNVFIWLTSYNPLSNAKEKFILFFTCLLHSFNPILSVSF